MSVFIRQDGQALFQGKTPGIIKQICGMLWGCGEGKEEAVFLIKDLMNSGKWDLRLGTVFLWSVIKISLLF